MLDICHGDCRLPTRNEHLCTVVALTARPSESQFRKQQFFDPRSHRCNPASCARESKRQLFYIFHLHKISTVPRYLVIFHGCASKNNPQRERTLPLPAVRGSGERSVLHTNVRRNEQIEKDRSPTFRWSYGLTSTANRLRFADHLACYGDIFWCLVRYFLNPIFYISFFSFKFKFAAEGKKITGSRLYHELYQSQKGTTCGKRSRRNETHDTHGGKEHCYNPGAKRCRSLHYAYHSFLLSKYTSCHITLN